MKRLKTLIALFCMALSIPLAFVIWQTYQGVTREERSQLRFFSETLFDDMEADLSRLIQREESRAVDEYHHTLAGGDKHVQLSPLSRPPREPYIVGYLQNNPDGSFQTPLVADMGRVPSDRRAVVQQLKAINAIFNGKKFALSQKPPPATVAEPEAKAQVRTIAKDGFADRYLSRKKEKLSKGYLGKKTQRTEEITVDQALNLSREDQSILRSNRLVESAEQQQAPAAGMADGGTRPWSLPLAERTVQAEKADAPPTERAVESSRFQVEVAPLQSVLIDKDRFFIFRRIGINNQIYRQGFVIQTGPLLQHLAGTYFAPQPMASFSRLSLQVSVNSANEEMAAAGAKPSTVTVTVRRTFPAPFDFCSATVQAGDIPGSPARQTLNVALAVLGFVMLLGLFFIYHSVRTIVEVSERRAQFVSSVTHELKTPLTNIRMYIEMLEQGIAANPEREQDYFQILGSESSRLSRLINNVLEMSKLEKKQRHLDLQPGNLDAELREVERVMAPKLKQEGFTLAIETRDVPMFRYDSEVMIQLLINLIENSVKFGRTTDIRRITIRAALHKQWVQIAVSDTGPGIPRKALKSVFDDFYRVDNELTRTTGGTGIGLALVKKFVEAMGGHVRAINNDGPGCTIMLNLPATPPMPV
jgi:signal transduction histidine kinase